MATTISAEHAINDVPFVVEINEQENADEKLLKERKPSMVFFLARIPAGQLS